MLINLVEIFVCFFLTFLIFERSRLEKSSYVIMLWAFLLRLILMFVDYYQILSLPGSGGDTEMFHDYAISNQHSSNKEYVTNYSVFLTYLYAITDCSRLFAQYLNVIMGMFVLIYLNKTLLLAKIDKSIRLTCLKIVAFLPNLAIFSAILLREAWIEMFVIMSVYYFTKWYTSRSGNKKLLISFMCVIAATWMHVGSIALLLGYMVCLLVYDRKSIHVHFSRYSIAAIGIIAIFVIFLMVYADSFFSKFTKFSDLTLSESMESVMDSEKEEVGSAYLAWLTFSNPVHIILFIPLKMFYFLYSPIPFDWRGIMDVIAFLLDSSVYIYLSYKIIAIPIEDKRSRYQRNFLLISFLLATFIFSMGTIASGTAIRHRAKILSVLLVCYGITMTYRKRSIEVNEK